MALIKTVADMFIVCGVLYAVDRVKERDTRIRFALDLYKNTMLEVELPFTNPFKYTTALGYNPRINVSPFNLVMYVLNSHLSLKFHDCFQFLFEKL